MANKINIKPNDSGVYKIDLSMFPDKIMYDERGMEIEVNIDVPFKNASIMPEGTFKIYVPPLDIKGTELEKVINLKR